MGRPIDAAVRRVLLGDFQGNGRASVLGLGAMNGVGAAYARLFFLEEDGTPVESDLVGFPVLSPVLEDLSSDGRDDFVFSLGGGLGVLLGQPTQELVPVAYPLLTLQQGSSTLAYPLSPRPGTILDQEIVIFVSYGEEGALESLDDEVRIADLPHAHDRLAGEPVAADVIQDGSAPCGELVFGYEDEPEVWMVQPCQEDGSWATPDTSLRLAATLPDGFVVATGPFLADLDGDDVLDLIVGANDDESFVSLGCGTGEFCAVKDDMTTAGRMLPLDGWYGSLCSSEPLAAALHPIAVGDLNGDGTPDIVSPRDVLLLNDLEYQSSKVRVEVCPAASKLVGQWTTAKIEDLNLDGHPDVIAGSSTGLDLEFYAGTGLDRLNLTRITTQAPVSHMAIGDFDGDLVPDLAVGLLSTEETEREGLGIAYGRLYQPPEPLVPIASFSDIDEVVAAHFDLSDAVEELGVVARNAEGLQTVTVFLSSGGRRLLAPFGLAGAPAGPGPEADVEGAALSIAVDDFTGDGTPDIASFSLLENSCSKGQCEFRLWVTPSNGEADLLASMYGPPLPTDVQAIVFSDNGATDVAAFPLAVDVDGNERKDVVLLAPWASDLGQTVAWLGPLDLDAGKILPVQELSRGPIRLTSQSQPLAQDLDGDGQVDLLALSAGEGGMQLMVAWGSDGIDLRSPEPIGLEDEPLGFATIQADTDELLELLVVGRAGLYLLQRGTSDPRVWEPAVVEGVDGGTSVAARDIDGDGLQDIAVADELGVRLYRGGAKVP